MARAVPIVAPAAKTRRDLVVDEPSLIAGHNCCALQALRNLRHTCAFGVIFGAGTFRVIYDGDG